MIKAIMFSDRNDNNDSTNFVALNRSRINEYYVHMERLIYLLKYPSVLRMGTLSTIDKNGSNLEN